MFLCGNYWKFWTVDFFKNFLNSFQYLNFETDILENKNFLKKLEHCFLVESTKIESALFPYKTAISEATVKTNRMVSIKWTYHNERSFASFFQFKSLL